MSTVKIVLELLNAEERDDMRAAIITANIKPTAPDGRMFRTSLKKGENALENGNRIVKYIK